MTAERNAKMHIQHMRKVIDAHSDGTTHILFEPLDFIARLTALVPRTRVNLTRFHSVFAPNSKYRARVTLAKQAGAEGLLWVVGLNRSRGSQ